MTEDYFTDYWNKEYPKALPINHELKWMYPDRWLRIHSLPKSKRYAEVEDEFKTILKRQNHLIDDLLGKESEITILFGLYENDIQNENYIKLFDFSEFNNILTIDLHKKRPEDFEDKMLYKVFVKNCKWEKDSTNEVLRAIADDEIRAMLISHIKKIIIAPYDGGVDVIVESTEQRNMLKTKYKKWLSKRSDGM